MKRLLLAAGLVLAACNPIGTESPMEYPIELTYQVSIDLPNRQEDLMEATGRTIQRRLTHLGVPFDEVLLSPSGDGGTISVNVASQTGADMLTDRLTQTFDIRFMKQVDIEVARAGSGLIVGETEGYIDTGLTDEHVDWVSEEPTETESIVTVGLTPEGEALKTQIFTDNKDGAIGMFVRNQPVYKLVVEDSDIASEGIIINIPDPTLSPVFVDDINVSNHVLITPLTQ